uniref:L1 transposable element RRM domain-containing protein n=1 Tax=Oryzias melastigma TaxID=30732 RepID=A0A3B3E1D9_ORYME
MEITTNFETLSKEICDIRDEMRMITKRIDAVEQRLSESEGNDRSITHRCEQLESSSRRNNIRIYSVPEKSEGNDMIREKLGLSTDLHIQRAHRAFPAQRLRGLDQRPRSIVVCFQSYVTKQSVLKAAWTKKVIQLEDNRIYFDEDFTPAIYKESGKYKDVHRVLRERKIKHHIVSPARLNIFCEDGKIKIYDNLSAASNGLREFGLEMDPPAEEPVLDSILNASGWQTRSCD